jgi:uncharacterized membrane protein YphA (DoxX/SURF4 family)
MVSGRIRRNILLNVGWLKTTLLSPWLYRLLRWCLAAVFVYAGALKLADPGGFAAVLTSYDMAPPALLPWAALGLPVLEVLAGLGLLFDLKGSLGLIAAMLLAFAVVLWFGVLAGLEIDCGCFSSEELAKHGSMRRALYRDLIMLAVCGYLYCWRMPRQARGAWGGWRLVFYQTNRKVES